MANPNPDAHEAVIRAAYASAGLDVSQTAMVEAHGTGTPVGDPIEVEAIARCFGRDGTYLGAVSSAQLRIRERLLIPFRSNQIWDTVRVQRLSQAL